MTYFGFLLIFLVAPIGILLWTNLRSKDRPWPRVAWWLSILVHVTIAVLYTTPWDNYLVATRVWWYDPALVTGLTIWWVPIEEYTFFVLQPILGGLWLTWLYSKIPMENTNGSSLAARKKAVAAAGIIWAASAVMLLAPWDAGNYLGLELVWAMPPIMLQLGFGADILRRNWKLVLGSIVPLTLYLSLADALAINFGTWTISPEQSLGFLLGGILPVEEFIFFLLTNTLVTFGIVLLWAEESMVRFNNFKRWLRLRIYRRTYETQA